MMYARDFRARARQNLAGKWGVAVAVGFVATLLTGGIGVTNSGSASAEGSGYLSFVNHEAFVLLMTTVTVSALLSLIIGGAVQLGWCRFHIDLASEKEVRFGTLFSQMHRLWAGFVMNFVVGLFILLWSLLLIVPGIIATYRYAMVPYLMAEFPELKVMDAIRESKRLMQGNKWRLFCLQMSFFGWALLVALTFGIGSLWLTPYIRAAEAAFYMDVTGRSAVTGHRQNTVEW